MKYKYLLILGFVLFFTVRLIGVGGDITNSDAGRWHRRSEKFLEGLKRGDFKETYQRYHPGVTLMWINATVKQAAFEYQLTYTETPKTLENADYFPVIHGVSKAAMVVVLGVLLALQVYFLSKLFNSKVALVYLFLVSFEPYLVGIHRWFHQTSLETFLAFTSILALLLWYKTGLKKPLIVSAVLLGFSLLAKITTLILGPVFLAIFVTRLLKTKDLKDLWIFAACTIATIFVFFPALWVAPGYVFSKIYGAVSGAVSGDIRSELIPLWVQPFYYLLTLGLKLSPVTLVLGVMSFWNLRKSKDFTVRIFFLTFVVYYLFFTITDQKIDRYSIAFFPIILSLAAVYLAKAKLRVALVWGGLSLAAFGFAVYTYHPVYSAYYSPAFGGTKAALNLGLYDNSGEYFAQAASYLNEKGRGINTWVPNGFESFNYYYKGNTQRGYTTDTSFSVQSFDMTRLNKTSVEDPHCSELVKSFGPRKSPVVFVFGCE